MTNSVQDLTDALSGVGLTRVAADLAVASSPCIRLIPTANPTAGESRIGGLPHLPAGQAWPSWKRAPLSHLCQIDLSEVAHHPGARPLPPEGILSFFYDADQSTWGFDPAMHSADSSRPTNLLLTISSVTHSPSRMTWNSSASS